MRLRRPCVLGRLLLVPPLMGFLALACPHPIAARGPRPPAPDTAAPKNIAELRAVEAQVKTTAAKVLPAVVSVQVGPAEGSGVVVTAEGLILTAGHIYSKPGEEVQVRFANKKTAKGITLGIYSGTDAGMIKITDKGPWPFAEMGRSALLARSAWCLAIGHPLGYDPERPPVVRIGRALRIEAGMIQTDCPIVAGDSGGPVFDLTGKVVGINSRIGGSTQENIHVPVDVFHRCWDRLLKGETWREDPSSVRDSSEVKAAFRGAVTEASRSVVRVKRDGRDAALGTIVGADGWILTKASEARGSIVCRLGDARELPARVVGVHPGFDLAMLKIEATGLPVASWDKEGPTVGQWVASPGMDEASLGIGILGVPRRTIRPARGAMGVDLAEGAGGVQIETLVPKSPAEQVGLLPKDLVTHIDGQAVGKRDDLIAVVRKRRIGDTVKVTIKRGKETKEFSITLAKLNTPGDREREAQNRKGVGISGRCDDFPIVLQHDTVLRPADCGGPLVDLGGQVLGVNIAHAGRTECYSAPADEILKLLPELKSGKLAPPAEPAKVVAEKSPGR